MDLTLAEIAPNEDVTLYLENVNQFLSAAKLMEKDESITDLFPTNNNHGFNDSCDPRKWSRDRMITVSFALITMVSVLFAVKDQIMGLISGTEEKGAQDEDVAEDNE